MASLAVAAAVHGVIDRRPATLSPPRLATATNISAAVGEDIGREEVTVVGEADAGGEEVASAGEDGEEEEEASGKLRRRGLHYHDPCGHLVGDAGVAEVLQDDGRTRLPFHRPPPRQLLLLVNSPLKFRMSLICAHTVGGARRKGRGRGYEGGRAEKGMVHGAWCRKIGTRMAGREESR